MLRIVAAAAVASSGCNSIFGLRGEIRIGGFSLVAPSKTLAATQLALTSIWPLAAATALWMLLPPMPVSFVTFAAIFSAATALGVVSHMPGGVGVFELVVLWAFRDRAPSDAVAAALAGVSRRRPCAAARHFSRPVCSSSRSELRAVGSTTELRRAPRARRRPPLARSSSESPPFAAGVTLLVSGATPTFGHRLTILSSHLPLWTVETSHFLGSLIGVVFLFVARGLLDRRDGAWRLAFALTIASLGFSLAKGLAYGEVGFFSILGVLLLATRPQFHRPTSMLDQPFTMGWFAAVGIIITAAFGILLLAFHNVDLAARDLWELFDFDAQAPRALRALLGASILALGVGVDNCCGAEGDRGGSQPDGPRGCRGDHPQAGPKRRAARADGRQEPSLFPVWSHVL